MSLTLVTAPEVEPVSEAEAWAHLRVNLTGDSPESGPTDRNYIASLITSARQNLDGRDGWLGRCLVTQTWDLTLDSFPGARYSERGAFEGFYWSETPIRLPLPPIQSVTYIKYVDTDGVLQTLDSSKYVLGADRDWQPRVNLAYGETWPSARIQPDAVTVRFVAGYASGNSPEDASAVPTSIKQAMLLMIGEMYENRETHAMGISVAELPTVRNLLTPYRVLGRA